MWIEITQEIIRALAVSFIIIYLTREGKRNHLEQQKGWYWIIAGFGFILFGVALDITHHFELFKEFVVLSDTPVQVFLEKTVGYLTGYVLLFIGFIRWLPMVSMVRAAERDLAQKNAELQESRESLELKVEERTNELYATYEQLYAGQAEVQMRFEEISRLNVQLRETRDSLLHAEKMAGIGTLAAGVAHEINNPLAAIIGYAEGGIRDIRLGRGDEEHRIRSFEKIGDAGWRCARIINALKSYARSGDFDIQPHNFNGIIESALSLITPQVRKGGITFSLELGHNLPPVECDDAKLQEIVINLVKNAKDAVESGGKITVRSGINGNMAFVEVADTGTGIPKEIQEKVFNPFFTTKELGKGLGLGLSVCAGIVEMHGGTITLESEEGKGTRVAVSIPVKHSPLKEKISESSHGMGRYDDSTGPEGYTGV